MSLESGQDRLWEYKQCEGVYPEGEGEPPVDHESYEDSFVQNISRAHRVGGPSRGGRK